MKLRLTQKDALILVDIQNDFCTGTLAVSGALEIIGKANNYIELFRNNNLNVFVTRDWHPINHSSFKEYGGIWPKHCVQNTFGAQFYKDLRLTEDNYIISKATEVEKDAYSGFDNTQLHGMLQDRGVKRLFVGGISTDYCVKATILDALNLDYTTFFLSDASCAVDINDTDGQTAINQMLDGGAILIEFSDILDAG